MSKTTPTNCKTVLICIYHSLKYHHPSVSTKCTWTTLASHQKQVALAYPKSWTGPWTLDSGLWTLDSGLWFFSSQNFIPPPKKTSISPPPEKTSISPRKNLYISPMKLPPPPINISSPKYSVRVFKQTTLFPPTHLPEKTVMSPP